MKKQVPTVIEIEVLAPSTLSAPERREPVSLDRGDYPSKPETRGGAALRWLIDSFALASCGMAGVYVGVWLDEPNVPGDQTNGIDEISPRQRGVATARHDPDGFVTPASACWTLVGALAKGHEEDQLCGISVPARGH
jgi:hypothetical protein